MGTLYRLPSEVRMEIYRFVLPEQNRAILPMSTRLYQSWWHDNPESVVHPDVVLFRTSKAIYREAIDVFYSEQIFKIDLWNFSKSWTQTTMSLTQGCRSFEMCISRWL